GLGAARFFRANSDSIWSEGVPPNLLRPAGGFDPASMDALLLLAPTAGSIGYDGRGDFALASDGRLRPRGEREVVPFVYAGAAILASGLFADPPPGPFGLSRLFDRAAQAGPRPCLPLAGACVAV